MSRRMKDNWLSKRLRTIGKTKVSLAEYLHMPQQHVNSLADGKSFTPERLTKLAQFLEIDKTALLEFFTNERTEEDMPTAQSSTQTIPVIGYVQAGLWQEARQWEVSDFKPIYMPTDERFWGRRVFALQIRGNSMNKLYPEGSCVICVSAEDYTNIVGEIESGKKVVVQRKNPLDGTIEATVKEYVKNEFGTFLMPHSTDPTFTPIRIDDGSAGYTEITGVVIGSFRKE